MGSAPILAQADLDVFLWIVGSRPGASLDEILAREQSHDPHPCSRDQIRESLWRLEAKGLITCDGLRYHAEPSMQSRFLEACRNCRDTLEENQILHRLLES